MTDKSKTCLSLVCFLSMLILPPVGLAIGWIGWGFSTGAIVALIALAVCFLLAAILLAIVKELAWMTVALPFLLGFAYTILPDCIVGPFDDTAVFAAGALMTFALWVRKDPSTPKWIVLPLLAASLYTLVGELIPGPVDELLVSLIGGGLAVGGYLRRRRPPGSSEHQLQQDSGVIEGESRVRE
ncbi:MAG: hypothetical protein NTU94_01230 [Planctomycetota bacterium]|nr:hypothetical protein [Planctomycetota bacterium]